MKSCVCGHSYEEHKDTPEVRYCKVCALIPGPDKCTYFRPQRRRWWRW